MNEALLKKLRYKEGPAAVINPPEGYELGVESKASQTGKYEFIQLFVYNSQALLEGLKTFIPLLNEDGLLWITYPKQSSKIKTELNRDRIFEIVINHSEYRVVSNVSIDDSWSALRVRHLSKVKTKS